MSQTPHEPYEGGEDIVTAQPDAEDTSADELAGHEVEPEHDADVSSFARGGDDNGDGDSYRDEDGDT